jgi:mRNA interferase MazF
MVRGEVFRLPAPREAVGHEQRGARFAVVVQSDEFLGLSTTLVAPTSVEQTPVVDPRRRGESARRLDASELRAVDEALALILGL